MTIDNNGHDSLPDEVNRLRQRVADLEHYQQQYINLFEYAGDSIFIIDGLTYRIIDVNNNAIRRLGFTREELLQFTLDDLEVMPESGSPGQNLHWISSYSGTTVYECFYRCKDERLLPVEVSSRVVTAGGQSLIQTWVRDISERKHIEQQRLALALEQERIQILSKFISKASHEFRTPLSNIQTRVYLLRRLIEGDESLQYLNLIEDQANSIIDLVDAMITMCQIDRANPEFNLIAVDLNRVVQRACQSLQSQMGSETDCQSLDLSESLPHVLGNAHYLQIAVEHVWNNAIRHTPDDGTIVVRTQHNGEHVTLEIADTGHGIDETTLPHIFEHFYRADVAGTTRGLGLGLPIAKAIIELHDGEIHVASQEGRGSTFTILLPVYFS